MKVAKENKCEFSLLHSSKPHLQDYYHKLGWSKMISLSYGIWRVGLPDLDDDGLSDKLQVRGKFDQYNLSDIPYG